MRTLKQLKEDVEKAQKVADAAYAEADRASEALGTAWQAYREAHEKQRTATTA